MTDWQAKFSTVGAYWLHDGHPERPYARLTSGLISNVFFNGGKIASEHPMLLTQASSQLAKRAGIELEGDRNWRCIGPAKGAICLSYDIAVMGGYRHAWADKESGTFVIDPRFSTFFSPTERIILVEDTITTGGSVVAMRDALMRAIPGSEIAPFVLALCNRSGKQSLATGEKIIALVEPDARTWPEGSNPFTPDGKELVEPVRPKVSWDALTGSYI